MSYRSTMPKVIFVVVNWNQRQLTLDCLASLYEQCYPNFDVVLVDNGSEDDSVSEVRATFPEVIIKENGKNLGIAAANNVGIHYALENEADYVFLLNNDTVVDPAMLDTLVAVAESDPMIGATGPTMLYFDLPETIWCAGNCIDWSTGSTYRLRAGETLNSVMNLEQTEVDFITSCAVCIKTSVLQDVGLMDETYFIYYDETDWFARARARGWRIIYVPEAKMWHKVSAAMGTASPATDYYMTRNVVRFTNKNLRGLRKIFTLIRVVWRNLLVIAAYTLKSHRGKRIPNRNARLLALRDACLGRWGKMGADVERACYANG
jgi:GT2 family glycosyltransferase